MTRSATVFTLIEADPSITFGELTAQRVETDTQPEGHISEEAIREALRAAAIEDTFDRLKAEQFPNLLLVDLMVKLVTGEDKVETELIPGITIKFVVVYNMDTDNPDLVIAFLNEHAPSLTEAYSKQIAAAQN